MPGSNLSLFAIVATALVMGVLFLITFAPEEPATTSAQEIYTPPNSETTVGYSEPVTPPQMEAGSDVTVDGRQSVLLRGQRRDSYGGRLTYRWSAEGNRGYFDNPDRLVCMYTAPSVCGCQECILLTLTATNERGATAQDQLYVIVRGDPITCPQLVLQSCRPAERPCHEPCPIVTRPFDPCAPDIPPCEMPCVTHICPPEPCGVTAVPCCTKCEWPCYENELCAWSPGYTTSCPLDVSPTPIINRRYPDWVDEGESIQLQGRIPNAV